MSAGRDTPGSPDVHGSGGLGPDHLCHGGGAGRHRHVGAAVLAVTLLLAACGSSSQVSRLPVDGPHDPDGSANPMVHLVTPKAGRVTFYL